MLRQLCTACASSAVNFVKNTRSFSTSSPAFDAPVYVVFGATGGIGSALAARLVKQPGSTVLLCGREESTLQQLQERVGGGVPFVANPTEGKAAEEAISKAMKDFGRLDGVANCVGSLLLKGAHTTSEDEFRYAWETNSLTAFNVVKAAVKPMQRSGGGSIVLFSSAVARHGVPNHEAIASAKAAVYGLALSAAATYAPKNVRVNCVSPGMVRCRPSLAAPPETLKRVAFTPTDTPLASKITASEAALKASKNMHPLKRIGSADEPAAAAEFLLLPGNSNITGQMLCVDGGLGSIKAQ